MTRDQFLSCLRRYCRKNGLAFRIDSERGKGSHVRVFVGDRSTIVKAGELKPHIVGLLLRQLGLPKDALR